MWRVVTSVHFEEDPAAVRHRAQEANGIAWKGKTSSGFCGFPALFDRRLFVNPVHDLRLTTGNLLPGARRGNYQLCAMGAAMDGERGGGVPRRRARCCQCGN